MVQTPTHLQPPTPMAIPSWCAVPLEPTDSSKCVLDLLRGTISKQEALGILQVSDDHEHRTEKKRKTAHG
jgi:hypothetical protein